MDTIVEHYIDAKGLLCPVPVLKFKKYIKSLDPGEIIRIDTTDPDSVKDFNVYADMKGFRIVSVETLEKVFRFEIKI